MSYFERARYLRPQDAVIPLPRPSARKGRMRIGNYEHKAPEVNPAELAAWVLEWKRMEREDVR